MIKCRTTPEMCVKTKNTFFGVNSPNTVRKDTQEFKLPTALTTVKKISPNKNQRKIRKIVMDI